MSRVHLDKNVGFIGGFVSYIGFIGNIGALHPLNSSRFFIAETNWK